MKCKECLMENFLFNERIGETECLECGLVVQTEPFEQTVRMMNNGVLERSIDKGHMGSVISGKGSYKFNKRGMNTSVPTHLKTALVLCQMVLSGVQENSPLSKRVEECYLDLYKKAIFGNTGLENRATAVVWYVLKENKTPFPLSEITKEFECSPKVVRKLSRKIVKHYKNKTMYAQADTSFLLSQTVSKITDEVFFLKLCQETLEAIEPILESAMYNRTPSFYACIAWITKNINMYSTITISKISKETGIHRATIYKNTKSIIKLLGYEKVSDMKGKKLN